MDGPPAGQTAERGSIDGDIGVVPLGTRPPCAYRVKQLSFQESMVMRKVVLAGLSAMALMLGGCGQNAENPATSASEPANTSPENAPGVTVADAIVRLPAVAGAPGVAYFAVALGSGPARKVSGVYVEGAERAEMHETVTENGVSSMQPVKDVALEKGKTITFSPGGLHIMLFGVADTLKPGGTTEITITLDNGDKVSAPARIESIGGQAEAHDMSGHDMSGMDHDMSKM
jgi:periplasmic copper chaperone A